VETLIFNSGVAATRFFDWLLRMAVLMAISD